MLPASYGFSGPAARYEILLPRKKIGGRKVPLFAFFLWKADRLLRCNTHLFVIKNKGNLFLSLNKVVLDLNQIKKICTKQNTAKFIKQ
jgi:hypothetical protein